MARSIPEWQERLDREGSVTFRQSTRRIAILFAISLLFVATGVWIGASDGASFGAIFCVAFFGLCALVVGRILVVGAPTLTVTRTGLTRSGTREVAFREIRELLTSKDVFGFLWQPQPGEALGRRSERKRGLRSASIPIKGAADPSLLAQWILHLKDPSGEIVTEPAYGGLGARWRLADVGV